jgi:hypothetical protein
MAEYPTSLGTSDADHITLLGQDLAGDLMGVASGPPSSAWRHRKFIYADLTGRWGFDT